MPEAFPGPKDTSTGPKLVFKRFNVSLRPGTLLPCHFQFYSPVKKDKKPRQQHDRGSWTKIKY